MPLTSQTHCDPKCTGGATFWDSSEHSRKSFYYACRARPLHARLHILLPYFSGPILSWTSFLSFSGSPSARPIFHVPLFPGALCTGARRPGASLSGSPCCAALCVTRSCLTSPAQESCPVNLGSMQAGRWNLASRHQNGARTG